MGNGINKVLPDLFLGNFKDARDKELLAKHNITHILSIHDTAAPILEEMKYLCIPAADASKQNLTPFFKDSIIFIHESRLKGKGCLVHCVAGVSRSVTLVVVYIMTVTGRGWVEALAAVRVVRPCAGPNVGFLRQLEDFENLELAQRCGCLFLRLTFARVSPAVYGRHAQHEGSDAKSPASTLDFISPRPHLQLI
ncbi:dual specificity protein phosphatase 22-B-like isoform X2 [Oncorhynchus nerka]|uniref:dual specificity protein phosphatase 22-B-like isoform X2 n=1 Tax=Oncorhynchus nerka TaxID=8023 RepID=UPI001131A0A3|nr:dual specificity protein phosphatase 22-B-like isoform X2 [Oncorhynchus nerka]